ncbi:TetR/AcrR family transcriptional regulator [Kibdelosporangium phytohabitans]|uniref:TetR family transcriptional regulator n=1 Tax=Kibdelosporangium phytohabitans TaxID=860235 RepID=A0A0N9HYQ8_9PSEU|nr:TetR/AcrR family transcriptional regulator [Kibdelosporangium phytohabitans]ALG07284.1 TetR family transcriptional regulator [Kibdelosporangium phytohabitans]MBE1471854.1 AcrR family transcriptional regulator [Kibdelosporangium phytohabitans]
MSTAGETPATGRPRSETARQAVLHAVDNMLVEQGYAAMTMKGIAERAGVGKQTVYRWWSSKAEILHEAATLDASHELASPAAADSPSDLAAYAETLVTFLTTSHAGLAYRALVGEAQHDPKVAELISASDLVKPSARAVIQRAVERGDLPASTDMEDAIAELVGPILYLVLRNAPARSRGHWRRYAQRFLDGRRS